MAELTTEVDLSVIVPVCGRRSDPADLYAEYKSGLRATGRTYEIIFVLDGPCEEFNAGLRRLLDSGEQFTVIGLTRSFGEATALTAGFEYASGQSIVTLPAYHQVDGAEVDKLVQSLETCDMAVGHRWPRTDGFFERVRRAVFHRLLASVTHQDYHDLGCGARAFDRRVLEEIQLYGDQHRFLPVLADRLGFKVREVDLRQSSKDRFTGIYGPRVYARGFLDIFSIFFLVRFTKKPLRFFGMIGVGTSVVGVLLVAAMVVQRLFFNQGLSDRPALLLASLLVVLGLQLFALGLLGELMIFTHARSMKDYQIERVIQFSTNERD